MCADQTYQKVRYDKFTLYLGDSLKFLETLISFLLLWIYVVTTRKVIPSIIAVTHIMCVFCYDIRIQ